MARLKVEGHVGLVRDSISKAVINTNKSGLSRIYEKNKSKRNAKR